VRQRCLETLDVDMLCIAETHLTGAGILTVDGYTWIGQNRKRIHVRAKVGSGGVGVLVKNELYQQFDVCVLEDKYEGILWLSFKHRLITCNFNVCVCYLPPENSTRYVNAHEFFDTLLTGIYDYQNMCEYFICGDFNSRLGDSSDYIAGVDDVPCRTVIDMTKNTFGGLISQFLIDANNCVLNGRNPVTDDFTYISARGRSVVDYSIVPYESLPLYTGFEVIRASHLVQKSIPEGVESRLVPDHSALKWVFIPVAVNDIHTPSVGSETVYTQKVTKYDVTDVPSDFCSNSDVIKVLNDAIVSLENDEKSQDCVDSAFNKLCDVLKNEMHVKLTHKTVTVKSSVSGNKKRRLGKPWWNDTLTELWNEVCTAEKAWVRCKNGSSKNLKQVYVSKRKTFDRHVQRFKRNYWFKVQNDLASSADNPKEFWKTVGKVGVGEKRNARIPMEVTDADGNIVCDHETVLETWRNSFSNLLNPASQINDYDCVSPESVSRVHHNYPELFSEAISMEEVQFAVDSLKNGKAHGVDGIPGEIIKVPSVVNFLHRLLSVCFNTGKIPSIWYKGIVHPIPKSSTADARDPMSYRGITLTSVAYKVYCSVLNRRLTNWAEDHSVITDHQNGFRKGRSTIDSISTLTNMVETRKRLGKSTFCAFIDFRKAYDCIDRPTLWQKLHTAGIGGKMFLAVKSLYENVQCSVRVNGFQTDWFDVNCGLKQGCSLSPTLFNLFINDLATELSALGKGVHIDNEIISLLMYADDIALVAESPDDLQDMLNCLNDWCVKNKMCINPSKSKTIHFRPASVQKTTFCFVCGDDVISMCSEYKYLGLVLNEFLDFKVTAKCVSQSANRALGLVIAKVKSFGGVPYSVFTKLYDAIVYPVIAYGAAIWGTDSYSCVDAVQNRASRYFLNVGRYTPNAAVAGDIGWTPMTCRQLKVVGGYWCRITGMSNDRVNKRVSMWANVKAGNSCKNWPYRVKTKLITHGCVNFCDIHVPVYKHQLFSVFLPCVFQSSVDAWQNELDRETAKSGKGGNKLRVYRQFKSNFYTEFYCKNVLSTKYRGALAKFRSGTAPIRIETGRYEGLPICDRVCFCCDTCVEDELHVILHCPVYEDLRVQLFHEASYVCSNFNSFSDIDKLCFIMSNNEIVKCSAKTCWLILERRRNFITCK
jgi:hypothetical protein